MEVWGRGTNRVIEMCEKHGTALPVFEERQGFIVVTFKAQLVAERTAPQVTPQVSPQVSPQVRAVLDAARQAASAEALQHAAGLKDRVHFLKSYLQPLLEQGWLERTTPDKGRSRLQKYRVTAEGEKALKARGEDGE